MVKSVADQIKAFDTANEILAHDEITQIPLILALLAQRSTPVSLVEIGAELGLMPTWIINRDELLSEMKARIDEGLVEQPDENKAEFTLTPFGYSVLRYLAELRNNDRAKH